MSIEVLGFDKKLIKFSGGELQPRVTVTDYRINGIFITAHLRSSDDIMELLLVTDAIRRENTHDNSRIHVTIPYFPYARQDRVCYPGEALSVKVMADLLNSQKYESVTIWDPHSSVTPALINNVKIVPAVNFVSRITWRGTAFVAPDSGAIHRVRECAEKAKRECLECTKVRSPITGKLSDFRINRPLYWNSFQDCLIIDDICDGGATFIGLARELQKYTSGKIYLYVTHGIFSQGLDIFDGLIDHIYCANPWPGFENHKLLTKL